MTTPWTERLEFDEVFKVDGYGLIVHFSDGTVARYTVDELANMRPSRALAETVMAEAGVVAP